MERKYKAFISYRHADLDSAVAKSLHSLIEQYKIPKSLRVDGKKKMGIVFRDEEELSATNDLTDKIYTALDNSEHLVVICTKSTLKSPWVTKEVEHFLKNHDRDKAHIILADGEPMEVFPQPLTHRELENGMVEVTEPMAVDVRAENTPAVKKKLKTQVLRLFAAMLGCPYDALAMREQHRKRQRFAAVMSAILAIAIGFSTVLLVKNHQIDKKNAELDSANIALESKNEELDKKNEELEEKNAEVLMRESELLTANSEKAFREGDNYNAIANAALALPTKTESRPYYAPAEAALLTAISPFDGEDNYIMRDTVLEQSTPVETFRISADGSKLATIDLYSVVTIFDTVTGDVLNTVQLNTNTVYLAFTHIHLLYCPQADCVIAFDGTTIAAVSFETCDILWTHDTPNAQTDFICPSGDGSTFAYMSSVYNEDKTTDYELVFISGETGEVVGRSTFIDSDLFSNDNYRSTNFKGYVAPGMYNGRFSADNSKFITTFFSNDENNVYTIHYSLTDIAAGTSKIICSFEVDGYFSSHCTYFLFFDTDDTVIATRKTSKSGYVMTTERINLKNGKLLWQTAFPKATLTVDISETDSIFCFTAGPAGATAYTILGNAIYSFDTETGEIYSTNRIPGKVVDADIANGSFVYVLENGHYSTAILSTYGISDVGDAIDLGDTLRLRVWNGGPNTIASDDIESTGYLATIPADNPRSVLIKRISPIKELLPYKETDLCSTGYFSANYPRKLADGSLAIGPFFLDNTYFFRIINPDTGEFIKDFPIDTSFGAENMLFLPDGSGIIYTDYYGDVKFYKEDGTNEMISDTEYLFLSFNDTVVCEISSLSASAVLSETGNILTAVITEDTLNLWTNAKNKKEVPLPEDLNWLCFDGHSVVHFMEVSPNGSIFVSDFTNDDVFVDRFAVYSTVSGKWSYITLNDYSLSAGLLCFSDSSSNYAILDENGVVSVYDSVGNNYSRFSLNLPANSIYQMELILDDTYVFIKTTDLQVLIFDIATGEKVYQETDVSQASTLLQVYHDSTNNRLYVATASTSVSCAGLCIDTTSWTTLARINGLIYFNENTLEMHRVVYKKGTYQADIIFQALPPTKTLSELAREFLGI